MKYAVTDIGTNTIRSVIYDEKLIPIAELVTESAILQHTENGQLTSEGISVLVDSLGKAKEFFKSNNTVNFLCFATSAMRDVSNFNEVNKAVKHRCGFEIELLSEKAEAMSDFASLKIQLGTECSGAGIDLGGGSCQVLVFERGILVYFCSRKLGVKRLYNMFGALSRENEREVREYIRSGIDGINAKESKALYVMGGTSKKLRKAVKKLCGTDNFTVDALGKIIEEYYACTPEYKLLSGTEFFKLPFGALVIEELCGLFGSERIIVMNGGVREGYIALHCDVYLVF